MTSDLFFTGAREEGMTLREVFDRTLSKEMKAGEYTPCMNRSRRKDKIAIRNMLARLSKV